MAQATNQHTPKTLDDAARFLIEERGYEKNPALCWEILGQIWAGRIKLRRHWKKYDLNGNPQEDGAQVVDRAAFRSRNLDFDRHGHIRVVPEWGDDRYTIVEPCDFWIIWPAQASQSALDQQPGAGPSAEQSSPEPLATKDWLKGEVERREKLDDIPAEITAFSRQIHSQMKEALKAGTVKRVIEPRTIETRLRETTNLFPKKKRSQKS